MSLFEGLCHLLLEGDFSWRYTSKWLDTTERSPMTGQRSNSPPSQVHWITAFIGIAHRSMGDWSPHYRQIIRNPGDNEGKLLCWDYFPNFRQSSRTNTLSSCFGERSWVFLAVWDSWCLCLEFICFVMFICFLSLMSLSTRRNFSMQ